MVGGVGEVDAAREFGSESGEGSIVRHIAGREDKSSRLAVKSGQLLLEIKMPGTVASDIPSTSSTVTVLIQSTTVAQQLATNEAATKEGEDILHGLEDDRVVTHT